MRRCRFRDASARAVVTTYELIHLRLVIEHTREFTLVPWRPALERSAGGTSAAFSAIRDSRSRSESGAASACEATMWIRCCRQRRCRADRMIQAGPTPRTLVNRHPGYADFGPSGSLLDHAASRLTPLRTRPRTCRLMPRSVAFLASTLRSQTQRTQTRTIRAGVRERGTSNGISACGRLSGIPAAVRERG
jgi:hypothetical protein